MSPSTEGDYAQEVERIDNLWDSFLKDLNPLGVTGQQLLDSISDAVEGNE